MTFCLYGAKRRKQLHTKVKIRHLNRDPYASVTGQTQVSCLPHRQRKSCFRRWSVVPSLHLLAMHFLQTPVVKEIQHPGSLHARKHLLFNK